MRRTTGLFIAVSILLTLGVGYMPTSAQKSKPISKAKIVTPPDAIPRPDFLKNLPRSAQVGASAEAKAAWEKLTPAEQAAVHARIQATIVPLLTGRMAQQRATLNSATNAQKPDWRQLIARQSERQMLTNKRAQPRLSITTEASAATESTILYFTDQNGAINSVDATQVSGSSG